MDAPVKKHPCPDCRQCQWCGDDRCRLCLRTADGGVRKLSLAEQVRYYEELNRAVPGEPTAPCRAERGPVPTSFLLGK